MHPQEFVKKQILEGFFVFIRGDIEFFHSRLFLNLRKIYALTQALNGCAPFSISFLTSIKNQNGRKCC